MDITELRTFKWISIISGMVTLVAAAGDYFKPGTRLILVAAGVPLVVLGAWFERQRDRLSAIFSGISRYFDHFPMEGNREVLATVKKDYCYLGVSFASVFPQFRQWYEDRPPAGARIRILLTDPDADSALDFQARYQWDLFGAQLSPLDRQRVQDTVAGVKTAIHSTCSLIRALRDSGSHIEVRFHREKLRVWMHFVDGERVFLGLLHKGKNGLDSPVIELRPRRSKWSLFNHNVEQWESLWESAQPLPNAAGQVDAARAPIGVATDEHHFPPAVSRTAR